METLRWIFDMLPDVAGILLAALSLSLIFLPKELRVLEKEKFTRLRWLLAIVFAVVGVGGLISNALQKSEDKRERGRLRDDVARLKDNLEAVQKKMNENRHAVVGLTGIGLAVDEMELKANVAIPFFISYGIQQNVAKNFRAYQEIFSVLGTARPEQNRKARSEFQVRASLKITQARGEDKIAGTGSFKTLDLTLSGRQIEEILMQPKRMVYIMGRVEWINEDGSEQHLEVCTYMEPPTMKYLIQTHVPFHDCGA